MVIKIFYIVIAIFSVAMVFLSVQTPYFEEMFKVRKTTIHADSADVLLEAVRNVEWESIEG